MKSGLVDESCDVVRLVYILVFFSMYMRFYSKRAHNKSRSTTSWPQVRNKGIDEIG